MSKKKLVYRKVKGLEKDTSFHADFLSLFEKESVSIVCPYITLSYLNKLIDKTIDWKLITDYYALLELTPKLNLDKMEAFIIKNQKKGKVLHKHKVHAKVIINSNAAYLGSANLTHNGVFKRDEMGVVLEGNNKVNELQRWFDDLWVEGHVVEKTMIKGLVKKLKKRKNANEINDPFPISQPSSKNESSIENHKAKSLYDEIFYLKSTRFKARGKYLAENRFIVFKGSEAKLNAAESTYKANKEIRESLVSKGVLVAEKDKYIFKKKYTFSSPASAVGVILAASRNGLDSWKTVNGVSLKEMKSHENQIAES